MGKETLIATALVLFLVVSTVSACRGLEEFRSVKHLFFYEKNKSFWDMSRGDPWGKMTIVRGRFVFNAHRLDPGREYTLIRYNGSSESNVVVFPYRRAVSFESSRDEEDYTLQIPLDTASLIADGKLNSDCSDLVVLSEGGDLLPRIVEGCGSDSAKVVVAADVSQGSGQVFLLYGSGVSFDLWNASDVYLLHDDFDDGQIGSQWTEYEESNANSMCEIYEQDGYLYMDNHKWASRYSATECGFRAVNGYQPGITAEFRASLPGGPGSSEPNAAKHWLGLFASAQANDSAKTAVIRQEDWGSHGLPYRRYVESCNGGCEETQVSNTDAFQDFRIEFQPGAVRYYVDGASVVNHTHVGAVGYFGGWATWFIGYLYGDRAQTRIDWVKLYKSGAVSSYSVGAEESGSFGVEHPYITTTEESLVCIASGEVNDEGDLHLSGEFPEGWNETWLLPSEDVDCGAPRVLSWDLENDLYGHDLLPRFTRLWKKFKHGPKLPALPHPPFGRGYRR